MIRTPFGDACNDSEPSLSIYTTGVSDSLMISSTFSVSAFSSISLTFSSVCVTSSFVNVSYDTFSISAEATSCVISETVTVPFSSAVFAALEIVIAFELTMIFVFSSAVAEASDFVTNVVMVVFPDSVTSFTALSTTTLSTRDCASRASIWQFFCTAIERMRHTFSSTMRTFSYAAFSTATFESFR